MQQALRFGDCTRLKSGGPVMVIFSLTATGAYCRWLNGQILEGATFDPADLEPTEARPPMPARTD